MSDWIGRVWIGSLRDYNEGRHIGRWFNVDGDTDEWDLDCMVEKVLEEATKKAQKRDPDEPEREEFYLADWEGFKEGDLSIYTPTAEIAALCSLYGSDHYPEVIALARDKAGSKADAEEILRIAGNDFSITESTGRQAESDLYYDWVQAQYQFDRDTMMSIWRLIDNDAVKNRMEIDGHIIRINSDHYIYVEVIG